MFAPHSQQQVVPAANHPQYQQRGGNGGRAAAECVIQRQAHERPGVAPLPVLILRYREPDDTKFVNAHRLAVVVGFVAHECAEGSVGDEYGGE